MGPVGLLSLTQDWDGYYLSPPKSKPHLVLSPHPLNWCLDVTALDRRLNPSGSWNQQVSWFRLFRVQQIHWKWQVCTKSLWDSHPVLCDYYLNRLDGLLQCLPQNKDILQEYDSIIRTQLQQRIVETVEQPKHTDAERVHYTFHTMLLLVYDASFRANGPKDSPQILHSQGCSCRWHWKGTFDDCYSREGSWCPAIPVGTWMMHLRQILRRSCYSLRMSYLEIHPVPFYWTLLLDTTWRSMQCYTLTWWVSFWNYLCRWHFHWSESVYEL